jgi:peroxiredoxin
VTADGNFKVQGELTEPIWADISYVITSNKDGVFKRTQPIRYYGFIDKGNTELTFIGDSKQVAHIKGSLLNDEKKELDDKMQPLTDSLMYTMSRYFSLSDSLRDLANTEEESIILKKLSRVNEEHEELTVRRYQSEHRFILDHPHSYYSLWLLAQYFRKEQNVPQALKLLSSLSSDLQTTVKGRNLKRDLQERMHIQVGNIAPEFSLPDKEGRKVALSEYQGRYVLIDFWASWCVPCRAENKKILEHYSGLQAKNLSILGISIDTNRDHWVNALKQDQLVWDNVIDLDGAISKLYFVSSVPTNFLLNKKGEIVGRNLDLEHIEEILSREM